MLLYACDLVYILDMVRLECLLVCSSPFRSSWGISSFQLFRLGEIWFDTFCLATKLI